MRGGGVQRNVTMTFLVVSICDALLRFTKNRRQNIRLICNELSWFKQKSPLSDKKKNWPVAVCDALYKEEDDSWLAAGNKGVWKYSMVFVNNDVNQGA